MISVRKRNGQLEPLDINKLHKVVFWACEDISGVSVSEIELKAQISLEEGISTKHIQETLIKSAADLISEDTPNYDKVAARLVYYNIRKEVYGGFTPWHIRDIVKNNVKLGYYEPKLLDYYSDTDFDNLEDIIKHERDDLFRYAGMEQFRGKYLIKNRVTGQFFETPQVAILLIAATLYMKEDPSVRMTYIKELYDAVSTFDISLPTPVMGGIRSRETQGASCVLIDCDDTTNSICASSTAIKKYICNKAGIGLNVGRIRAIGSEINKGKAEHTGLVPLINSFQGDVKSFSQGGIRGGSATVFFQWWHYEYPELVVLKNNKGTEYNRVRHMDYGVQLNRLIYQRLLEGGNISLFSPKDVPGLNEAFYRGDNEEFERLYVKYEKAKSIRKRTMPAKDWFTMLMTERRETGRIYIQNIDHCNTHSSFKPEVAPITMSNLCVAPETRILTKQGYQSIGKLENQKVDIWNGEEWSEVTVKKTGENQSLIKVIMSDFTELHVTPYHKFYIQKSYRSTKPVEVRATDLKPGMKIIKHTLPFIEEGDVWENAYQRGFFAGDGTFSKNRPCLWLYGKKRELVDQFAAITINRTEADSVDRTNLFLEHNFVQRDQKFEVPINGHFTSKLEWLAGVLDADGCVTTEKAFGSQCFQISSINLSFLKNIQLMLQTIGIHGSVNHGQNAGTRVMPDGKGGSADFECNRTWRLIIATNGTQELLAMGLPIKRHVINKRYIQRDARHFIKVTSVEDSGRIDDTFCFTEPKRNMGVFEGIIAGNCVEITLPTSSLEHEFDEGGRIALCILAAVNLGKIKKPEDFEKPCRVIIRALDALIDYQDYMLPAAREFSLDYRALGVGVINLAYWLAKNDLKYDDNAVPEVAKLIEAQSYYLIKASVALAKEKGPCRALKNTKYGDGILPIDTANENALALFENQFYMPWEELREELKEYGIRNATVMALMPSETSAQISNATNGVEPPRALISDKTSKHGRLSQVVPEINKLKNKYDLLWDQKSPDGYLKLMATIQCFVDQSISTNVSINPENYPDGQVSMMDLISQLLRFYSLGGKTLYYHNTYDGQVDEGAIKEPVVQTLSETVMDDEDCDSCKI